MIGSHLKIAIRNIRRHKAYSAINVCGLAAGVAVCLLIALWVEDELSYDRFHVKADRIYRAIQDGKLGDNEWMIPLGPLPLADALGSDFPEVEGAVRIRPTELTMRHKGEPVIERRALLADSTVFDLFSLGRVAGDLRGALRNPGSVVITTEAANRYFSEEDPVGRTLSLADGSSLVVTAVVEPFPQRSHIQFDFLLPLHHHPITRNTGWQFSIVHTYILLREGASISAVENRLGTYLTEKAGRMAALQGSGNRYRIFFQPLLDIHLYSSFGHEMSAVGNIAYVYSFGVIGTIVLLLACINFINLSTARATDRAREVGVRKVMGSQRGQLIRQFLSESLILVLLAILVAMMLVELALPWFNDLSGKNLTSGFFLSVRGIVILFSLGVTTGLVATVYPAFVLSSFSPADAFKANLPVGTGGLRLRNALVIVQFTAAVVLIVSTLVVKHQMEFVQSQRLGFDKEHVLVVRGVDATGKRYTLLRERLMALHRVVKASAAQTLPGRPFDSTVFEPEQPANYDRSSLTYAMVDEFYVETLGLNVLHGRGFSGDRAGDSTSFILNQAAAAALGWEDPLGRQLNMGNMIRGPVIGVVENFHYESLHTAVKPVILVFLHWTPQVMAVRLTPGNLQDGIDAVRSVWSEIVPERPFQYSFLDADFERQYQRDYQVAGVFGVLTLLTIAIACVGVFGLASFAARKRTKEIGVRKVLGASVFGIATLLTNNFLRLVVVANVLAWPIAYYLMNAWLEKFAYRIDVGVGEFIGAGVIAIVIALFTVSYQSIRAALANPVEALRYE